MLEPKDEELLTPGRLLVCHRCGHIQGDPAPCDMCGSEILDSMEGSHRAKALMPQARPL